MGGGLSPHRYRSRYESAFRRTGRRWTFSLHPQSALPWKSADGGRNRRSCQPTWFCVPGRGELDFCLSAYSSRRRSAPAKPGRIVSRLSAGGAALLAVASAASSFSWSPSAMGTSVRRGKLCLDLRVGRIIDRNHIERAHWWRRISARVPRLFYSPPISPETESAVRCGEFVVNKKSAREKFPRALR